MPTLYLVGTHHLDIKGPERLEKFLGFVRPDTIGLEITQEDLERRIQDHTQLESQNLRLRSLLKEQYGPEAAENVVKYLNMLGYELWVPTKFAKSNGTRLICCDEYNPQLIQAKTLELFGDMVSSTQEVTINFIDEIAKADFEKHKRRVDLSYDDNSVEELRRDPSSFQRLVLDRDDRAEPKIREAVRNANHALVYVGGTLHFFGDYPNLYEKLKDLSPVRVKLPEVDKF